MFDTFMLGALVFTALVLIVGGVTALYQELKVFFSNQYWKQRLVRRALVLGIVVVVITFMIVFVYGLGAAAEAVIG